ncbi:hypothetical protein IFM89_033376 [Coptis chinensis]|uniref:glutaminase n=1 Tax=Coptis chinensis TaxID=261450 RepID=A0A835HHB4_9MAGN|nr:hypothetical protein IFM89_033376 [Coptis chinensis]
MAVGVLALQGSFNEHIAALRRLGVKGTEIRKAEQLETINALIIPGGESTTMAKLAEYHNLFPALREFVKMGKPVWGTCAGLIFLADKAVGQKEGGQELVGGLDCLVHRNFFGSQIQSFEADLLVPELVATEGGPASFRGVFIRAPAILEAGTGVEVLADYSVPSRKPTVQPVEEDKEEFLIRYVLYFVSVASTNNFTLMQLYVLNGYWYFTYQRRHSCSFCSNSGKINSEEKVIVAVKQGNLLATAFHPELTADTRWHSYFMKMVNKGEQPFLLMREMFLTMNHQGLISQYFNSSLFLFFFSVYSFCCLERSFMSSEA